jgi:hypothetical protein
MVYLPPSQPCPFLILWIRIQDAIRKNHVNRGNEAYHTGAYITTSMCPIPTRLPIHCRTARFLAYQFNWYFYLTADQQKYKPLRSLLCIGVVCSATIVRERFLISARAEHKMRAACHDPRLLDKTTSTCPLFLNEVLSRGEIWKLRPK